jgi:tRNA pseudouridine38-40 synthase
MPRFKLTIEYAGTRYSGWQIQKNARTVQGEIDRAVRLVTGRKDFELYGSGRTDAGVHAAAQVAHLDVATSMPPAVLCSRLNEELAADVNILSAAIVPHRFHARHDAVARRYVYQVSRRRTAFHKASVWWVKDALDLERMRSAARVCVGLRDFRSFAESDDEDRRDDDRHHVDVGRPKSTRVLIDRLDVVEDGDLILVVVEGSHFLWKMVRRLVGVVVEVGRGGVEVEAVARWLVEPSGVPARLTAPASGLFLARVYYGQEPREAVVGAITPVRAVIAADQGRLPNTTNRHTDKL